MAVTALYLRISSDDDNHDISASVANQLDLLSAYVAADPVLSAGEVLIFADDGWSGTNFERPKVKELLELARRGKVQNILVKDLSRWGRNYPEVSEYLDQIFPFLGVRFISVNDRYDSNDHKGQTAPMGVAFSSIVHDMYSKELSFKIRQAQVAKSKRGEYVLGAAPYGYIRPKAGGNKLVIDEAAATIIRRIFDMAGRGIQNTKIAAALNAEGIDSPLEHRRRNGRSTLALSPKAGRSFWDGHTIYRIIRDERYTGVLISFKSKRAPHRIRLPESEWIRVPGALPAIIPVGQFERVKAVRQKRQRPKSSGSKPPIRAPFVGEVVCGHCNHKLKLSKTARPFFRCLGAKAAMGLGCYDGLIRVGDLEEILLATVKLEAQKAIHLQERHRELPQGRTSSEALALSSELKRLTANKVMLEHRALALYEAFARGNIDRGAYVAAKSTTSTDLETTQNSIAELNQRLAAIENVDTTQPSTNEGSALHHLLTTGEATGAALSLLDRMIIYDDERIEVRFNFQCR